MMGYNEIIISLHLWIIKSGLSSLVSKDHNYRLQNTFVVENHYKQNSLMTDLQYKSDE